jgi:hypothetical protein
MPSSSAARVAWTASSTRCFFSFISVSVAAPTLITATPPDNFASRSWSFSRSKSESVVSISDLSCLIRALIPSVSPAPSMIVAGPLDQTERASGCAKGDPREIRKNGCRDLMIYIAEHAGDAGASDDSSQP